MKFILDISYLKFINSVYFFNLFSLELKDIIVGIIIISIITMILIRNFDVYKWKRYTVISLMIILSLIAVNIILVVDCQEIIKKVIMAGIVSVWLIVGINYYLYKNYGRRVKYYYIVLSSMLGVSLFFVLTKVGEKLNIENFNKVSNVISTTIVLTAVGSYLTYYNAKRSLRDSYDSKSGWRKEVHKVASSFEIKYDDVQRIRASLRFVKKEEMEEKFKWINSFRVYNNVSEYAAGFFIFFRNESFNKESLRSNLISLGLDFNYDLASHLMTIELDRILKEGREATKNGQDTIENERYQKIVRLFVTYLLKWHWSGYDGTYEDNAQYVWEFLKEYKKILDN